MKRNCILHQVTANFKIYILDNKKKYKPIICTKQVLSALGHLPTKIELTIKPANAHIKKKGFIAVFTPIIDKEFAIWEVRVIELKPSITYIFPSLAEEFNLKENTNYQAHVTSLD